MNSLCHCVAMSTFCSLSSFFFLLPSSAYSKLSSSPFLSVPLVQRWGSMLLFSVMTGLTGRRSLGPLLQWSVSIILRSLLWGLGVWEQGTEIDILLLLGDSNWHGTGGTGGPGSGWLRHWWRCILSLVVGWGWRRWWISSTRLWGLNRRAQSIFSCHTYWTISSVLECALGAHNICLFTTLCCWTKLSVIPLQYRIMIL